ncbi:hypothetical protein L2E82_22860 [Cichorium intybus]|uniref:Uncharacterized protein n=1 Tax=Cichorium intybus TaxID=13427 RepID=A0ACB9DYJ2_CICIN|nr:hypothetical protein L2E82_22860 [Cichorium intybus]
MATPSKSGDSDTDTILVAISNVNLSRNLTPYKEHLRVLIHILSRHKLSRAFFDPAPAIPVSLLHHSVATAIKGQNCYSLTLLDCRKTTLDKKVFAAALQLPYDEATFDHPTSHQPENMIFKMGYAYQLPKLYQLSKGHISPLWQCLIHYIIKCLSGKMGGTDQLSKCLLELLWSLYTGYEIDYGEILFEDFLAYIPTSQKPKGKIHSARFWAMCIEHVYQTLQIPIPSPRSKDDKLVMPEAKQYAPKIDTVFSKLRKLPDCLLNLADPKEPALLSHLSETTNVSPYNPHLLRDCVAPKKSKKKALESSPSKQPPKKKQQKDKMEERQNSPDSEDTQEEINMVEKQNSPSKVKGKEKVIETPKAIHSDTLILDRIQPPADATEFDAWKFRTAVNEQATSTLYNLVDSPVYLFDTTEKDWSKISSAIVPLTWDKFLALERQKKKVINTTVEQSAESGCRLQISDSQSVPVRNPLFVTDQEEALVKEIGELNDKVAVLENRDILLHLDNQVEKVISDGLANIDSHRQSDATNMMKTATHLSLKNSLSSPTNHHLYPNSIIDTIDGPLQEIKLCTSLNIEVMEQFKNLTSKTLADDLGNMFTEVTNKLATFWAAYLCPLQLLKEPQEGKGGPSQKNQEEGNTQEDAHASKGNESEQETNANQQEKPTKESFIKETPNETLKETPTKVPTPHSSPPKTQTSIVDIPSEDEILMYSPIKESDPPEVKAKKSEYLDAQALLHAEGFSSESKPGTSDPNKVSRSGPSRSRLLKIPYVPTPDRF